MEKQPEQMTLCKLDCVLMPNGELICHGKTIGWFRDLKEHLEAPKKGEAVISCD